MSKAVPIPALQIGASLMPQAESAFTIEKKYIYPHPWSVEAGFRNPRVVDNEVA